MLMTAVIIGVSFSKTVSIEITEPRVLDGFTSHRALDSRFGSWSWRGA